MMVAIARARERFKFRSMTSPFQNAAEAAVKVDLCFRGCEEQQRSGASPDAKEIVILNFFWRCRPAVSDLRSFNTVKLSKPFIQVLLHKRVVLQVRVCL